MITTIANQTIHVHHQQGAFYSWTIPALEDGSGDYSGTVTADSPSDTCRQAETAVLDALDICPDCGCEIDSEGACPCRRAEAAEYRRELLED